MPESIFADEWRDCLRAHYTHVIRAEDKLTERTLRGVMIHEAGFTEAELKELQVRATAHVDDAPDDFVPDLEILREEVPVSVAVAMPQDVIQAMVVEEALTRDEGADALVEEALAAVEGLSEADLLDGGDLPGEADLMLEAALDVESDLPTAELLAADTLDDEGESEEDALLDGEDDAPEDEPPPDPDPDTTQLSLF
jgi:hypothetical protein